MHALFAPIYVEEIAAVQRTGGHELVRAKLAALSEGQRRALRDALDEFGRLRRQGSRANADASANDHQIERLAVTGFPALRCVVCGRPAEVQQPSAVK